MLAGLQILVFLLAAVAFVAFIALRSGVASPILLVASGVLIAVAPGRAASPFPIATPSSSSPSAS